MSTDAQIAANRENAQSSTGPVTTGGKSRVSRNATTLGLFTMNDFVLSEESTEHHIFCTEFADELRPAGPTEELYASEMIRAAWRLRRCGLLEAALAETPEQNEANLKAQTAIDRARAQANNIFRRARNDLRRMQNEPNLRTPAAIPAPLPASKPALAHVFKATETQWDTSGHGFGFSTPPTAPPAPQPGPPAITKQTQSIPPDLKTARPCLTATTANPWPNTARQAPCPCQSGEKYKRCCGRNAPPLLHQAA